MECLRVKELLSEYIDRALDEGTRTMVENHLSACGACKKELAALQSVVKEIHSLDPVTPPKDFLQQLHERMERQSPIRRILRSLFVPLRSKVPLQLATMTALAVIIFSILFLQQPTQEHLEAPMKVEKIGLAEKDVSEGSAARREKGPIESPGTLNEASVERQQMDKEVIELVLIPRKRAAAPPPRASIAMRARPPSEKIPLDAKPKEAMTGKEESEHKTQTTLLEQLDKLITQEGGKLLSLDSEHTGRPDFVHVDISTANYESFIKGLSQLGEFETPPPIPQEGRKTIQIRIRLLSSN